MPDALQQATRAWPIGIRSELWNHRVEPPRRFAPPLLIQGGDKTSTVHCFFPSLSKEGWPRQGPGWFAPQRGEFPQLQPDDYIAVLYSSCDDILEPLGQSQVLRYLERLARDHKIILISFEKPRDWQEQ